MFSDQFIEAATEKTVEYVGAIQKLTAPLSRNGQGFPANLEWDTRAGETRFASLQDVLMSEFPDELKSPRDVRHLLEIIAEQPGSPIWLYVRTQFVDGKRTDVPMRDRVTRQFLHSVALRGTRTARERGPISDPRELLAKGVKLAATPAPAKADDQSNLGI